MCLAITIFWMLLASRQVLGFDPYPYPFLLFLGNVVQLLLIFIIMLGQQVIGRATEKRDAQTCLHAGAERGHALRATRASHPPEVMAAPGDRSLSITRQ